MVIVRKEGARDPYLPLSRLAFNEKATEQLWCRKKLYRAGEGKDGTVCYLTSIKFVTLFVLE